MNKFLKNVVFYISLSIIAFAITLIINVVFGYKIQFNSQLLLIFGYSALYTFTLGISNSYFFEYLNQFFNKNRFTTKGIIVGFLGSILISLIIIFLLRFFEDVIVNGENFLEFLKNQNIKNYFISTLITFVIILGIHTFYFYKSYQENRVKEQKVIAGTANAKFESLKNQIDPHFLFNSLNVLSSLIEENPDNAQRFTTSLSKVYRYVLEQKDKDLVSVEEELSFAKTYMNLLKMRFENSLTYELPTENINSEAKVVPLSLQLLLENTVKHNVVSEQKPLHIKIFIDKDYLVIQNNFQKKEVLQDRQGVGLQNIINRYGIISNRKVLIEQNEKTFSVKIPILTKQVSVMETTANYTENNTYYRAKKRVEELRGFYGNLISYCCVIPILVFVNLRFSPEFQWFWFSAAGWGFGLTMHAFKVFGYSSNWEERKIKEILDKQDKNNWK